MKGRNNNLKQLTKPEVVVITGASAGLGRATARVFAREGAHIGLLARRRDRLSRFRAGLSRHPAAIGLLRREARHSGFCGFAALRTAVRQSPSAHDDGATASDEHAAVLLGQVASSEQATACAAHLPARSR